MSTGVAGRAWRDIEGAELRAFVRGKTVADFAGDWCEAVTIFTDGTAIRCSAEDGTVYSSHSADSAAISWAVSMGEK